MATISTISDQTLLVTAADAYQVLYLDGAVAAISQEPGEELRVFGTGTVEGSHGGWSRQLIVDGEYHGHYFAGATIPTERLDVLGSRDGIDWQPLAEDIEGAPYTYMIPPLWVDYYVMVRAQSGLPSQADAEPQVVQVRSRDTWLNWGGDWGESARGGQRAFRDRVGRRKEQAQAGDRVLTFRAPGPMPQSADVSVKLLPQSGSDDVNAWHLAAKHDGTVVYRDPSGIVLHAELDAFTSDHGTKFVQNVSFRLDEKPWP